MSLRIARALRIVVLAATLVPSNGHGEASLNSCRIGGIEARCGTVAVPETRAGGPKSRAIDLRVVVLPAASGAANPALFVVNGGPGASTVGMAEAFLKELAATRRNRDVVLIDQRGTGGSNPLRCTVADGHAVVPENSGRCLQQLAEVADLRFYGTDDAVRDLDEVRMALGYDQIDILAVSYGTRVAWRYAKTFPKRLRAVVLLSPNPPSQRLLESVGEDAGRAMRLLASDCRATRECRRRFPEFEDELGAVLDMLTPAQRLALPLLLYSPGDARRLPWMVSEAAAGNPSPLDEALASALAAGRDQISLGLHLTVQCSEEFPLSRRLEGDRLAAALWNEYASACRGWPRIPLPPDFRNPIRSEARALVISGEWDPATPPRWAAEMAGLFSKLTVAIIPEGSHGLSEMGACLGTMIARFLDGRPTRTACLGSLASRRYFVP